MNHFTPIGSYDPVKQESNRHVHVGEEEKLRLKGTVPGTEVSSQLPRLVKFPSFCRRNRANSFT